MRNILAVCSKELYTYFVSPIAYFVCFVFTTILGFLFLSGTHWYKWTRRYWRSGGGNTFQEYGDHLALFYTAC